MLDAIIIVSSLVMDIVFLNGVTGEEGQKAVAVLVVLLLWRIARVTDGRNFSDVTSCRLNDLIIFYHAWFHVLLKSPIIFFYLIMFWKFEVWVLVS